MIMIIINESDELRGQVPGTKDRPNLVFNRAVFGIPAFMRRESYVWNDSVLARMVAQFTDQRLIRQFAVAHGCP